MAIHKPAPSPSPFGTLLGPEHQVSANAQFGTLGTDPTGFRGFGTDPTGQEVQPLQPGPPQVPGTPPNVFQGSAGVRAAPQFDIMPLGMFGRSFGNVGSSGFLQPFQNPAGAASGLTLGQLIGGLI